MAGFEVLVLPVRATTAPGWPDAAYRHVLDRSGASVPPANRTSVGDYWFDVTDGAVDLSFRHHTPTTRTARRRASTSAGPSARRSRPVTGGSPRRS